MSNIFAKRAEAKAAIKADAPKKVKKETIWNVGNPDEDKVAASVHNLAELNAQKKTIDAKMKVHKTVVLSHAQSTFYEQYADLGVFPETPMKLQNRDGESVTFVVQERNQYPVKDESVAALRQLLGEDGAAELVYEEQIFGFDRSILAKDGVMEILGKHLEAAEAELAETGTLTEEENANLLDCDVKRSYRPGVLQRLALIAGKNSSKMRQVCEALGSGCVQYVKV
jgi:hypothetical protein